MGWSLPPSAKFFAYQPGLANPIPHQGVFGDSPELLVVVPFRQKLTGTVTSQRYTWELPPQDLTPDRSLFPVPRSGLQVKFRGEAVASASAR